MAKLPYMPFFPADYLRDTRCLSLAARGAWMDILCALWNSPKRGRRTLSLEGWAGEIGKASSEVSLVLHELQACEIGNISRENDTQITIISRRMVRDERIRKLAAKRKQKQRDKTESRTESRESHADVTGIYQKSDIRNQKSEVNKKLFLSDSIEIGLAVLLWNKILGRNPQHKEPNLQVWARTFDLMLRVDKRKSEDIRSMIHWCQSDPFWQNNILSPDKLRKQFDQLTLKKSAPQVQANKPPPFPPSTDPIARNSWRQAYGDPKAYGY